MDNNNPPIAPYAVEVPRPPSPQQPLNANVRAVLTAAQLAAQQSTVQEEIDMIEENVVSSKSKLRYKNENIKLLL